MSFYDTKSRKNTNTFEDFYNPDRYYRIPKALLADDKGATLVKTFGIVRGFCEGKQGECFACQHTIAMQADIGREKVNRDLSKLVELGWLQSTGWVEGRKTKSYRLARGKSEEFAKYYKVPAWALVCLTRSELAIFMVVSDQDNLAERYKNRDGFLSFKRLRELTGLKHETIVATVRAMGADRIIEVEEFERQGYLLSLTGREYDPLQDNSKTATGRFQNDHSAIPERPQGDSKTVTPQFQNGHTNVDLSIPLSNKLNNNPVATATIPLLLVFVFSFAWGGIQQNRAHANLNNLSCVRALDVTPQSIRKPGIWTEASQRVMPEEKSKDA